MRINTNHTLFVAIVFALALVIRSLAIAFEEDLITGVGIMLATFIASYGSTMFGLNPRKAWLIGVLTALAMCIADTMDRTNRVNAMEPLWAEPVQGLYVTDPNLSIMVAVEIAAVFSGMGILVAILVKKWSARTTAG